MRIGLISTRKKKDREGSVMLAAATRLSELGATLETIFPDEDLLAIEEVKPEYDLYLLKAGSAAALGYAGLLDQLGARIINPYPAVTRMKDKILATQILQRAGVPQPETWFTPDPGLLSPLLAAGPIIVKPYYGGSQGRGVEIIREAEELTALTAEGGLFFAQRYHRPDGRDHKIYRLGDDIFGVRRIWPARTLSDKLGEPFEVSAEMREITMRAGAAFGIDLYGLDIVASEGRHFVVDINTFPGFKGVPEAGRLLADYIAVAANRSI